MAICPRCGAPQDVPDAVECSSCGVIIEKYKRYLEEENRLLKAKASAARRKAKQKTFSFENKPLMFGLGFCALLLTSYLIVSDSEPDALTDHPPVETNLQDLDFNPRPKSVSSKKTVNVAATPSDLQGAIQIAKSASVLVQSEYGIGTGFFFNDECYILTNKHVVEPDSKLIAKLDNQLLRMKTRMEDNVKYMRKTKWDAGLYKQMKQDVKELEERIHKLKNGSPDDLEVVTYDGSKHSVWHVRKSEENDLALLDISLSSCEHFNSRVAGNISEGEKLYAIGNPSGLKFSVTSGIMSGLREDKQSGKRFIQTDTPINPGSSGGVLMDSKGAIVGINTFILTGTEGIGFAIPIETAIKEFEWYLK